MEILVEAGQAVEWREKAIGKKFEVLPDLDPLNPSHCVYPELTGARDLRKRFDQRAQHEIGTTHRQKVLNFYQDWQEGLNKLNPSTPTRKS